MVTVLNTMRYKHPCTTVKELKHRAGYVLGSITVFKKTYFVSFKNGPKLYWQQYMQAKDYFDLMVIQARDKLTKEEKTFLNELIDQAIQA